MSYPNPPYGPAAPYSYYPPFSPPPFAVEVDLAKLPLDELLERYAVARQEHRNHLATLDYAEKRGAQLRDQEQEIKATLIKLLTEEAQEAQRAEMLERLRSG